MEKEEINREYYRKAKLFLPKYSKFRIWKFKLWEKNKMIKLKGGIKSKKELRRHLLKLNPKDCYYSANTFHNPSKVRGNITSNYLMWKSIPFDFDSDKPHGIKELEEVRASAVSLIDNLRLKLGIEPKYILFTGGQGIQVVYEFFNLDDVKIKELKLAGIDWEITRDKVRVIRLPLTINSRTGRVGCFLTYAELNSGMEYILGKSKQVYSLQGMGDKAERRLAGTSCKSMTTSPPSEATGGEGENCLNRTPSKAKYVTNEVVGTKRFIPVLKYRFKEIQFSPQDDLRKLSEKYGLCEWFLIKIHDELVCISLASFDKRRVEKIINSSKSYISRDEFIKFGRIFVRTSGRLQDGVLSDEPELIGVLDFGCSSHDFQYSKPHIKLITFFKQVVNPTFNYIGSDNPRILEVCKAR